MPDKTRLAKAKSLLQDARNGLPAVIEGLTKAIEDDDASRIWSKLDALQSRRNDITEALEILIDEYYKADREGWAKHYRR